MNRSQLDDICPLVHAERRITFTLLMIKAPTKKILEAGTVSGEVLSPVGSGPAIRTLSATKNWRLQQARKEEHGSRP